MASTANFLGENKEGIQVMNNSGTITYYNQRERSPTKPNPSSTVPFRRDPDFVDRDILAQVDQICSKPAAHARAALVGLGGVGKSQLAIEYSYRIRERDPQTWIFWVHASSSTRFEEGYREIADEIKLPRTEDKSTADILQLVSNWLRGEANGRWIMILDNADDSTIFSNPCKRGDVGATKSLSTFLPQTPNGSILVTSRSREAAFELTGRYCDIINVEPMDEDCALLLFKKKLPDQFDQDNAKELLRVLDYMPLAISQAAAYINQMAPGTTVAKYLDTFRASDKRQAKLLNRDAKDLRRDTEASNSITTTWQISFEHIRGKKPSAARLLSLMSFFDRQGIPGFLLRHYDDRQDSSIEIENNADEDSESDCDLAFDDDVGTLTSYSLIKANVKNDSYEMHRIVQFSVRNWLQLKREQEKWKKIYIQIIREAFPHSEYKDWKVYRVLYPHAEAALKYRPTDQKDLLYWSDVLNIAGCFAATEGNYHKAEEMIRQSLEERMKALGNEHPDTLTNICNLALVLENQGKFEASEIMNRQALDGMERIFGKEHPNTLRGVGNLANILQAQKKFEASEELHRQVLDGMERTLGKEHPYTLTSISNLALVLQRQEKLEASEEMNRQALDGYEKILGKEHPDTLRSASNLAWGLERQGKFEVAKKMNRQILDGRMRILGKEHPDTLTSISNLASVLQAQGNLEAAVEMRQRALDGREKVLGKDHPATLESINNLALVLKAQGKFEAAEKMFRQALDGREKALGKDHPDTLTSINNLASVLWDQDQFEEAEKMNRQALDGYERIPGKEHPNTLTSISNLAVMLQHQEKFEAAEKMYQRELDGKEKTLGKEHPDTLTSISNLASMLEKQGKFEAAVEMCQRALNGREKVLGKDHRDTLTSMGNLASVLYELGKFEESEKMFRQALDGRERTQAKEHLDTLTRISNLASGLQAQGKFEAAEKMFQQTLDGRIRILGKEHPDTLTSMGNLVSVLLAQIKVPSGGKDEPSSAGQEGENTGES